MNINKLLDELRNYLDSERRDQLAKYDSIKCVLKKLKKKENALKDELMNEHDDDASKQLQREIDVIFAQRKKGVELKKALKKAREN